MKFGETPIAGAFVVEMERIDDERGFFARSWCAAEFAQRGLSPALAQCNVSFNVQRGTLRGLHYQASPHAEAKLVRCTMGALYNVVADLRPGSPSFMRWHGVELTARNRRMLYVPEACANGFQTLVDETEVLYQMSAPYRPESSRGVRWDDPAFGIAWPEPVQVVSERDRSYPDFRA